MPTDGPVGPIGAGLPRDRFTGLAALWLKPVEELLPIMVQTQNKPIGQFTMTELLAWACTLGYMFASITLAETMLLNLARVAVRGR
jgi:hypothetical protein